MAEYQAEKIPGTARLCPETKRMEQDTGVGDQVSVVRASA